MLIVKKFGGTSVADKERIYNVARRCIEDYKAGHDVVVVLSAMGKTTDELIALALETLADGVAFMQSYTYTNGKVSSVLFQSQGSLNVTENYLYTNGHLTEIKLDGQTSVWKLQTENVRGLATKVLTGDVTRTYSYDSYGLPTGRSAERGGLTVFGQTYSFDAETGNLEERTDETR